jgi:hypothetical protein
MNAPAPRQRRFPAPRPQPAPPLAAVPPASHDGEPGWSPALRMRLPLLPSVAARLEELERRVHPLPVSWGRDEHGIVVVQVGTRRHTGGGLLVAIRRALEAEGIRRRDA